MAFTYADRWALITGASSGIGAEFARQLAARGMHLVLVARREGRLEELARELDRRHGTRCQIMGCDLGDASAPRRLVESLEQSGLQIDLLVNNAGLGHVATIEHSNLERLRELLAVNVTALTELTYLLLPPMLERQEGGIINVASVAGFQPVGYMGAYAASKAYVLHLSESLWGEARQCGVTVMALCPGTTRTEFFDSAGMSGWLNKHRSQTPEEVVRAGLAGLEKHRQYYVPGWMNYFMTLAARLVPRKTVVVQSMSFFRPQASGTSDDRQVPGHQTDLS